MAKRTKKYVAAEGVATFKLGLAKWQNQEDLYQSLSQAGYLWDSKLGEWVDLGNEPSEPASEIIRIRVWADSEIVEEVADFVSKALKKKFQLIDRSSAYKCRPPKQLESRIYLSYLIKEIHLIKEKHG